MIAGAEQGVTVRYPEPPTSVGDTWISIDAELEKRGLRATGPYRQINHPDDSVTFQAPVLPLNGCP